MLRPLPTIFNYLRVAGPDGGVVSQAARRTFIAHLRAFEAMLLLLVRSSGIPGGASSPLRRACASLATLEADSAARAHAVFRRELGRLHGDFSEPMKKAAITHKDRFAEIFRSETGPLRLIVVYDADTWNWASNLETKLVEGCWYDCRSLRVDDVPWGIRSCDALLVVPGRTQIRRIIETCAERSDIPLICLAGALGAEDLRSMATLRNLAKFRRRCRGLLLAPFTAIRHRFMSSRATSWA
jgi:hypothetical protein